MAIKIFLKEWNGGHVEADTEEDMRIVERTVLARLGGHSGMADHAPLPCMAQQSATDATPARSHELVSAELKAMLDSLTASEKGGLSFLKKNVKVIRGNVNTYLERNFGQGIDTVFGSIKRKAVQAGVGVEDIFSHEAKGFGAAKTTTYIAGPLLLTVEEI